MRRYAAMFKPCDEDAASSGRGDRGNRAVAVRWTGPERKPAADCPAAGGTGSVGRSRCVAAAADIRGLDIHVRRVDRDIGVGTTAGAPAEQAIAEDEEGADHDHDGEPPSQSNVAIHTMSSVPTHRIKAAAA